MNEGDNIIEELRESYNKFGPIRKVIITQFGIAAGETRRKAVPEWPEVRKQVKDYYEHLKLKALDNISSKKPPEWWEQLVKEAAEEKRKDGLTSVQIVAELEKDFPLSKTSIYKYLPTELKNPDKVKAGIASGAVRKSVPPLGTAREESRLVGGSTTYPISPTPERRKADSPETIKLMNAFHGTGFKIREEYPVPMNKWKCPKCRQTWIEEPPMKCDRCGIEPERLTYKIDLLLDDHWTVEPGGKKHDFDSDQRRDAFLREKGYEPFHYDNDLVNHGAWLIVEYHKLLKRLASREEHTLLVEGHGKKVYLDNEEFKAKTFDTKFPATVRVILR